MRDGAGIRVDGAGIHEDIAVIHRDGAVIHRDGAGNRLDGAAVWADRGGQSVLAATADPSMSNLKIVGEMSARFSHLLREGGG